jgi:WD40 repeat protein
VLDATFHPDGKHFVIACADGSARIWELPSSRQAVERLRLISRALSGSRFDSTGGVVPLQMSEFRDIWRAYQDAEKKDR